MAVKVNVDFTNVKDSSGINPKQMPEGDYRAKIKKVDLVDKKDKSGQQLLFIIGIEDSATAAYPYYCGFEPNVLWKLRNLMIAAGVKAPKRAFSFDAEKLVGKELGITLADDEYNGQVKSVIDACFPANELEDEVPAGQEPEVDADVDSDDDDAVSAAPADEADDELDLDSL